MPAARLMIVKEAYRGWSPDGEAQTYPIPSTSPFRVTQSAYQVHSSPARGCRKAGGPDARGARIKAFALILNGDGNGRVPGINVDVHIFTSFPSVTVLHRVCQRFVDDESQQRRFDGGAAGQGVKQINDSLYGRRQVLRRCPDPE